MWEGGGEEFGVVFGGFRFARAHPEEARRAPRHPGLMCSVSCPVFFGSLGPLGRRVFGFALSPKTRPQIVEWFFTILFTVELLLRWASQLVNLGSSGSLLRLCLGYRRLRGFRIFRVRAFGGNKRV